MIIVMSHHAQLQMFSSGNIFSYLLKEILLSNNQVQFYCWSLPIHIDSPEYHQRQKSEPISDESTTPRLSLVNPKLRESLKSFKSGLHPSLDSHVMS